MHQLTNKIIKDVWVDGMPIHRAKEVDGVVREWLKKKVESLTCLEYMNKHVSKHFGLTHDPVEELAERFRDSLAGLVIETKHSYQPDREEIWEFLNSNRHRLAKEAIRWMEEKGLVVK